MRLPIARAVAALALVATLAACDAAEPETAEPPDFVTRLDVVVNPTGYAPLSAKATLETTRPVSVAITVEGRDGPSTDITHRFVEVGQALTLPVLGLYPGASTPVTFEFFGPSGEALGRTQVEVEAQALSADFPTIAIDVPASGAAPGVNLVSYFGHNSTPNPQRAFAFDAAGDIRWALDFRGHPTLGALFFDDGVERLANGNLYFGDGATDRVYEVDMLGRIVASWSMPGYDFHHNVLEKPDGNFLVTVDRKGAPTVEDVVIEIDRSSGAVVREWDLTASLDPSRRGWPTDIADLNVDWFHANGLAYDASDNTVVVSGRTQGVVKLTADNEVVWILAPHRAWARAGDGTDLRTKLLQPLDAAGRPISEAAVFDGSANHPDFEWAWYQHAPAVLPDGTVLVFDNGDNRNYRQPGTYSRAVVFRIDGPARTVQQVWEYGRERGAATYSRIVSDVDYLPAEDHVLFMPGAVSVGGRTYGKVVEVDRATGAVRFEATIAPPVAVFGITFHRVERLPLYPPD